jgi:hypothetical protein
VNRIEKNFTENKQKIYKKLIKKNIIERDNYLNSLNKYLEKQKEISETKQEKAFKKYQGFVSKYNIIFHYIYLYYSISL